MKHTPKAVRAALTTTLDEYELVLHPAARRVVVRAPDGKKTRLRIDLLEGFKQPAILGGVDRSRDIIAALQPILVGARLLAVHYELATFALVRHAMEHACDVDLVATETSVAMKERADALHEIERWCVFHADLAAREARGHELAICVGDDVEGAP